MGKIDNKRIENDMIDTMWSFMQMGEMKSNYSALKSACMEMRKMMTQKTAGQRKDRTQDLSWDNLERVKASIIVEAMALVFSGDLEPTLSNPQRSSEDGFDEKISSIKEKASELKDFCGEWDCTVCPFEDGKKCILHDPSNWKLNERGA